MPLPRSSSQTMIGALISQLWTHFLTFQNPTEPFKSNSALMGISDGCYGDLGISIKTWKEGFLDNEFLIHQRPPSMQCVEINFEK